MRILVIVVILALLAGCAPSRGVYHTVKSGQTLFRIARTYEVDERYLARLNGVEDPARLRVGQRLFIPGVDRLRPVPATVKATASPSAAVTPAPQPPKTPPGRPPGKAVAPAPASPPAVSDRSKAIGKGKFSWPLRGAVLRQFGSHDNRTCNGLEIAAPEGTPVLAAAAGRVTYSGNGIRGFGHLVILRHDDSFFTVYGYNRKNLVETGAFVSQGERIALSGIPPGGGQPRLHFEIRQGREPINPFFYLP